MMMMILSLGTPPPNTTHSSETPRSADTRVYRAGRYRPETHRYRKKGRVSGTYILVYELADGELSLSRAAFSNTGGGAVRRYIVGLIIRAYGNPQ